jgi:uncharacterized caspase-like protein
MAKGTAVLVGVKEVNPAAYNGWDGRSGCTGCEIDTENMDRLLQNAGFETTRLLTSNATGRAVLDALRNAARTAEPGDLFVFYYSGHGHRRPDLDGDELDGYDETLVLYDRQVVDDDLNRIWTQFPPGVRLLMISDSCHSGSNFRDPTRSSATPAAPEPISGGLAEGFQAQMIHMGGCRDDGQSFGGNTGGLFTLALVDTFRKGPPAGGYRQLYEAIVDRVQSGQKPQYSEYGHVDDGFRNQPPFTI